MSEAKGWRLDFDNLSVVERRQTLDPPGYDQQIAREPVCASCNFGLPFNCHVDVSAY